ncbi:hypothetical protein [Methylobacterium sp. Leaf100]|uniref:hypothetical protein n=1 Tax=Methylobacterium sp. Leaf100 TaxID=1736252 RepID=UPI0006F79D8A|nr:hypothetical protein [Methylobacterium sp. Leaf100]KQP31411.1 hypothetical protein ASF25_18465 [Methylobacterium sp. Leaf100]
MTANTNRRQFIALGGAAAAALALPPAPAATALPIGTITPKPPMPTWIVGTPGESDHEVIRAMTREAAIRFRAEDCDDDDEDRPEGQTCECHACSASGGYEATRVEQWDGRRRDSITDSDWLDAGFDANCARCGDVANREDDGRNVNGKAICGDCMKLADWEIVDPEIAAEMRADLADATALAPSLSGRTSA